VLIAVGSKRVARRRRATTAQQCLIIRLIIQTIRRDHSESVQIDEASNFPNWVPEPKVAKNRLHLDIKVARGLSGDERRALAEPSAKEQARPVEKGRWTQI
jgi:hypothetical protein